MNFHKIKPVIYFFGLIICLNLWACSNEESSALAVAENAFEKQPDTKTYTALMTQYFEALNLAGDDTSKTKPILLKALKASEQMDRKVEAIGFLNNLVVNNYNDTETPDRLLKIAGLLDAMKKSDAVTVIYAGMLRSFPEAASSNQLKSKLPTDFTNIESFIDTIGRHMFVLDNNELDEKMAASFVDACEAFAMSAPKDPNAVLYLHKAAETARTMKSIDKALSLYDWILKQYPNHPKTPQALFLKAFTYDNNLNNIEQAKVFYQEFLDKYPNDDFADDTKFLLENLGKSDEEILKALTEKGKK